MSEAINNVVELPKEKGYELRKLKTTDVSSLASILSKIGLKEFKQVLTSEETQELAKSFTSGNKKVSVEVIGIGVAMDIASIIFANYEKAEKPIIKFLASLSGKTVKEIESLDIDVFFNMIVDVIMKEEFKDFIKVVSPLVK